MHFSPVISVALFLSCSSVLAQITAGPSQSVSITDYPGYATGLDCLTRCIWGSLRPGIIYTADLAAVIGCGSQWSYNGCFCRADLSGQADAFLSTCISSSCSTLTAVAGEIGVQVTSAISIYDGYCDEVRAETAPPTTTTSFSGGAVTSAPTASAVATTDTARTTATGAAASSGGQSEQSSDEGGGLSKSDVIALGVGLGLGIPSLLIGAATLWVQIRKRKQERRERPEMTATQW